MVGEHRRNSQASVITCDSAIYDLREDAGALRCRMDRVREHPRIMVQRLVKVDEFGPGSFGHRLNGLLDLPVPGFRARNEAGVVAADGCHPRDQEPRLGIDAPETVDKREVIPHEFVLEVRPVARVRIVDPQMNHDDVSGELHRLAELFLLEIRPVAVAQERRARLAEVPDLVAVAQQRLQLRRIAFPLPVVQPHPVRDAVPHAGDLDLGLHLGLPARIGRNENERQREGADEQITPCHR